MRTVRQDPSSILDWGISWEPFLDKAPGDALASASWSMTGPDNALTLANEDVQGTDVVVWISGGTVGATYTVTCHVVTVNGREDDASFRMRIEHT